jgi:RimJ/RimL family protein N-acetyltransferase
MSFTLETPRLRLAPFTLPEATDLYTLHTDTEVNRYRPHHADWSLEKARERIEGYIAHQREYGFSTWRVTLHVGTFIGRVGLRCWPETSEYELGYSFQREHWGRGYATEAASTILNWAFENTDLNSITAMATLNNTASRRVLEKSGLRYRETRTINAVAYAIYEITRDEHRLEEETHG